MLSPLFPLWNNLRLYSCITRCIFLLLKEILHWTTMRATSGTTDNFATGHIHCSCFVILPQSRLHSCVSHSCGNCCLWLSVVALRKWLVNDSVSSTHRMGVFPCEKHRITLFRSLFSALKVVFQNVPVSVLRQKIFSIERYYTPLCRSESAS